MAQTGIHHLPGQIEITTLSSVPERISAGDVLVQVVLPGAGSESAFSVLLNDKPVKTAFHRVGASNTHVGLINGLSLGENRLDVHTPDGKHAALELMSYPAQGPIVSGPHLEPFICQTETFVLVDGASLGAAQDADCSAQAKIVYMYWSRATGRFEVLQDTARLPNDVAKTTTTNGATINFVVRLETRTINRGIYESALLHDPTQEPSPSPFSPPVGWNRRLIGIHGAGCSGGWYIQGGSNALAYRRALLLKERWLRQGYAVYTNTLQNPSDSCNAFLAGETAMMGKEHFIETYGVPDYSLSYGESGGAYTGLQIIDAFPGLFDGALIEYTFPDVISIARSGIDAHLLRHYFSNPSHDFTEAQQVAVSGYHGRRAWHDAANQAGRTDPVPNRRYAPDYVSGIWNEVVPKELRFDPLTNVGGARPTVWDVAGNIYGWDPKTGYALRPYDNVGVQYGLAALNAGLISPAQFIDLNKNIGGLDRDGNFTGERTVGDQKAILEAYLSGLQLSGGGGLANVPILDFGGKMNEAAGYHYQWFHFALRERLIAANGSAENFVMWRGNTRESESVQDRAFDLLNEWISAVKAYPSRRLQREAVIRRKPVELVDGCWTQEYELIAERQVFGREPDTKCNAIWPTYASPRFVAGEPLSASVLKCQLKPIDWRDYAIAFTAEEARQLQSVFARGVCDWRKPGEYFHGVEVGRSYGPAPSISSKRPAASEHRTSPNKT